MVVLRQRILRSSCAPFVLAAAFFALAPTHGGRQDLAALIAQQPDVSTRAREHLVASPFGTIHASVFSLPRPVGTSVPVAPHVMLATYDPATGASNAPPRDRAGGSFTDVNRAAKGDLLVPQVQIEVYRAAMLSPDHPEDAAAAEADDDLDGAPRGPRIPASDAALSLEMRPAAPDTPDPDESSGDETTDAGDSIGTAQLYFDGAPMIGTFFRIEPWAPGEMPVLDAVPAVAVAEADPVVSSQPEAGAGADAGAPPKEPVTVAAKGDIDAEPAGLKSPAVLLGLSGKSRAKAERCLANAVYFEARSEPVRGQVAVAQVVLNRVFSGYYPEDVCGVVYQGARRHLSCQFTFACDGIPDVVTEEESWDRAKKISAAALDGKVWLKEVGKATHYHARYVMPYWVRSMRRLHRIGLHSFYRPRRWGDGSDAPTWGKPANAEIAAKF